MSRRRKILRISNRLFPSIFGDGPKSYEVIKDGLPQDARIVDTRLSGDGGTLELVLESESFESVPFCEAGWPEIIPVLRTITTEAN